MGKNNKMENKEEINDIITTKSIGPNMVEIEKDFILDEKPMSRLVFHAQMHSKGIRGQIIRQRRESKDDVWIPDEAVNIRTLGKKESINLDINTEAMRKLYSTLLKLSNILNQKGIAYGEKKYTVADSDSVVISDKNKVTYIKKILNSGYGEDVWSNLVDSNPSLAMKLSYARIQSAKLKVVKELKIRLETGDFPETKGHDSWQKWIYKNNWLFGINYKKPFEKGKINIAGIMPDYLFPTLDGFVDILEIKLPDDEVLAEDSSHPGSWKWTSKTNMAIGQVVNYLGEIDRLCLEIEKNIKTQYNTEISLLKPRAYILIGNSTDWISTKRDGLRKMNSALHGIEILTYKDLLDRGFEAINTTKA